MVAEEEQSTYTPRFPNTCKNANIEGKAATPARKNQASKPAAHWNNQDEAIMKERSPKLYEYIQQQKYTRKAITPRNQVAK